MRHSKKNLIEENGQTVLEVSRNVLGFSWMIHQQKPIQDYQYWHIISLITVATVFVLTWTSLYLFVTGQMHQGCCAIILVDYMGFHVAHGSRRHMRPNVTRSSPYWKNRYHSENVSLFNVFMHSGNWNIQYNQVMRVQWPYAARGVLIPWTFANG